MNKLSLEIETRRDVSSAVIRIDVDSRDVNVILREEEKKERERGGKRMKLQVYSYVKVNFEIQNDIQGN